MQELHAIVSGRVQMVMMRDFVQRTGTKLGLVGYVQNLSDGTVEVVAQGGREALEKLVAKLHRGSFLSKVEAVRAEFRPQTGVFENFTIEY
jgi:acylphosphatase